MNYLVDSSAWVEYLDGGGAGDEIAKIIDGDFDIYTIDPIVAEIISKVSRRGSNWQIAYNSLVSKSKKFGFSFGLAREAGLLHSEMKKKKKSFSLADAFIVIAARSLGAKILTKDNDFRGFKEAIILD